VSGQRVWVMALEPLVLALGLAVASLPVLAVALLPVLAVALLPVLALVLVPWRSHMWEAPTYPSHPSDSQSCTPCNQTLESSWQGSEGSTQQLGHSTSDHSRCTSS